MLPTPIRSALSPARNVARKVSFSIRTHAHHSRIRLVRKRRRARAAFFVTAAATWRHGDILEAMARSGKFDTCIVLCPTIGRTAVTMEAELERLRALFRCSSQYRVFNADAGDSWARIDREFDPDLVFFDNPWHLTLPEYDLPFWKNRLSCYFPYTWGVEHQVEWIVNKQFHHLLWAFFVPSPGHRSLARTLSPIGDRNMIVSGHPGLDDLERRSSSFASPDKSDTPNIIWAPHHSVPGHGATLDWSCFFRYSQFMLETARRLEGKARLVFKPHPHLRGKVASYFWGERQTRKYWSAWEDLGQGTVAEGPYAEVFNRSSSMIHDCGSFTAEYLVTGKPVMYLWRDPQLPERFNAIGRTLLAAHYKGDCEEDIDRFIDEVTIQRRDPMAGIRTSTSERLVETPGRGRASEFIYRWIVERLFD